jgi:lysozyme
MNIFRWLGNLFKSDTGELTYETLEPVKKAIPLTSKEKFQRELDKRKIKYFNVDEVFFRGASDKKLKLNTEPPEKLWDNMWRTIEVADKARHKHGKPIKIASAYRSPKYNKAIGGATKSQHVQFNALDLKTSAPKTLHKILLDMRNKGEFKGGLGLYKTFVHIDTRGNNADWRG